MMDHRETAADGIYRMILYNLLCFASVPVFIFGRAARKVAGINYQNPITESCHVPTSLHSSTLELPKMVYVCQDAYPKKVMRPKICSYLINFEW